MGSDVKPLPCDLEKVAKLRMAACAAMGACIVEDLEGQVDYGDMVYAGLAVLAFMCGTAVDVPGVRLGVHEVALSVSNGALERASISHHAAILAQQGQGIPEDQFDA